LERLKIAVLLLFAAFNIRIVQHIARTEKGNLMKGNQAKERQRIKLSKTLYLCLCLPFNSFLLAYQQTAKERY
jgi:hypothetical protein